MKVFCHYFEPNGIHEFPNLTFRRHYYAVTDLPLYLRDVHSTNNRTVSGKILNVVLRKKRKDNDDK